MNDFMCTIVLRYLVLKDIHFNHYKMKMNVNIVLKKAEFYWIRDIGVQDGCIKEKMPIWL